MKGRKGRRSEQSAMEYLTTYGVALLLIIVALVIVYRLNLFSFGSFTPRVQSGACVVYRPDGPFSTVQEGLRGDCTGELPLFVSKFVPSPISNFTTVMPIGTNSYTMIWWWQFNYSVPINVKSAYQTGNAYVNGVLTSYSVASYVFPVQRAPMVMEVVTDNAVAGNIMIYHNDTLFSTTAEWTPGGSNYFSGKQVLTIGGPACCGFANALSAQVADIQLYNISLTQNQIITLYRDGPGGVPIALQNLLGWWPLNGNGNDYSGNSANTFLMNVSYSSTYTYTPQVSP